VRNIISAVFVSQQDTRTRPDLPKLDLHVLPLYKLGVTGRGVRVVVLDDGIEYTHEDLKDNYVSFCYTSNITQYFCKYLTESIETFWEILYTLTCKLK
jgi:subtilisin family serine protease